MQAMRLPRPGRLAFRVFARDLRVWRKYARASVVGNFLDPLFYLVLLGMGLGRVVEREYFGGVDYMQFLAPGLITSTAMYTATFECTFGSYTRMESQKTFAAIMATPVGLDDIVFGEALFGAFKAAVGSSCVLIVALALGLVTSPWAFLVPLAALLVGFFFASVALVATSLSPSYEFFNYHFTLFLTPMFLASGIFYPADQVPSWLRPIARALPLSWAVDLMRGLTIGHFRLSPAVSVVLLAGASFLALIPAANLIHRRLIK